MALRLDNNRPCKITAPASLEMTIKCVASYLNKLVLHRQLDVVAHGAAAHGGVREGMLASALQLAGATYRPPGVPALHSRQLIDANVGDLAGCVTPASGLPAATLCRGDRFLFEHQLALQVRRGGVRVADARPIVAERLSPSLRGELDTRQPEVVAQDRVHLRQRRLHRPPPRRLLEGQVAQADGGVQERDERRVCALQGGRVEIPRTAFRQPSGTLPRLLQERQLAQEHAEGPPIHLVAVRSAHGRRPRPVADQSGMPRVTSTPAFVDATGGRHVVVDDRDVVADCIEHHDVLWLQVQVHVTALVELPSTERDLRRDGAQILLHEIPAACGKDL
mmetsp:Transcript_84548/g.235464  ORF Transcript_84548/g.235464 Transcript_84548/m.235464 type:complete len:335 (+) Transcript_84548:271-1275(+)